MPTYRTLYTSTSTDTDPQILIYRHILYTNIWIQYPHIVSKYTAYIYLSTISPYCIQTLQTPDIDIPIHCIQIFEYNIPHIVFKHHRPQIYRYTAYKYLDTIPPYCIQIHCIQIFEYNIPLLYSNIRHKYSGRYKIQMYRLYPHICILSAFHATLL